MKKVVTGPLLRADSVTVNSEPPVVQRRPRHYMSISVEGTVRARGVGAWPGMQGMEACLGAEEQLDGPQAQMGLSLQILTLET